jgi:hypothetical protein
MTDAEKCSRADGSSAHCWHVPTLSLTLASNPPHHEEVCCFCGRRRFVFDELPPRPEGHGPFYPQPFEPLPYTPSPTAAPQMLPPTSVTGGGWSVTVSR